MVGKQNKGRPALIEKMNVIECALNIGLSNASMHTIGNKLGVSATALYRHFSSKDELIEACCDHIIGKIEIPQQCNWEQFLYSFGENFREILLSNPNSVDFVLYNQKFSPNSNVLVNDALSVMVKNRFEIAIGFMAFTTVFRRVTDLVQHQEQSQRYLSKSDSLKEVSVSDDTFPYLAMLFSETKPLDYDKYFVDSLKITIEGIKAVYC